MREILSIFEHLPDRQAAEAFSEPHLRPYDFKIGTMRQDPDKPFPPEKVVPTGTVAAYFDDRGVLRRQATLIPPSADDTYTLPNVAERFISDYRDHIGGWHEVAERAHPVAMAKIGEFALSAAEKARRAGLRTVAAFSIYSAINSESHYTGMLVPRRTFVEMPLESRDEWVRMSAALHKDTGLRLQDVVPEEEARAMRRILSNDPRHGSLAFFAAAQHLPESDAIEQVIRHAANQYAPSRPSKLVRPERRGRRPTGHKKRR